MSGRHPLRDVVVVIPGILGSTLRDRSGTVWAPSAGSVLRAISTLGRSLKRLALPEGVGDDNPQDGVEPGRLMPDLHLVPGLWSVNIGYDVLLRMFRERFEVVEADTADPDVIPNLIPFSYDWRLSNRYTARRLKQVVEPALERWRSQGGPFAEAKLVLVCHSMGGLVARWFLELEGGAELTRKLITLGTPYRGSLNALDQLVNGVRKGLGPFRVDLTELTRSLPSVHQLLPAYGCLETSSGLVRTIDLSLPELSTAMVEDGWRFQTDMDEAAGNSGASGYDVHPIVGIAQPTRTTARLVAGRVESLWTIEDNDEGGDATVPRLSAAPKAIAPDSPLIGGPVAEQHGSLQANRWVLDAVEGILTAPIQHMSPGTHPVGVEVPEVVLFGEQVDVVVPHAQGRSALEAVLFEETGNQVGQPRRLRLADGDLLTSFEGLEPGGYEVRVRGVGAQRARMAQVRTATLVWDPELSV